MRRALFINFFFFSPDDVTELSTPLGGGQREEPGHQEPNRPKPALQQAPRARRRRDRTGRDRTKTKRRRRAQREPARTRASTHARMQASKHTRKPASTQASTQASKQGSKQASGTATEASRKGKGPQDTYNRLTEPTRNGLTRLQPTPPASCPPGTDGQARTTLHQACTNHPRQDKDPPGAAAAGRKPAALGAGPR